MDASKIIGAMVFPALFLIVAAYNYYQGGTPLVGKGLVSGGRMLFSFLVPLSIAFAIAGEIQVAIAPHIDNIQTALKEKHGPLIEILVGFISPSNSTFPLLQQLYNEGKLALPMVISMIFACRLLNVQTLMFFAPLLGWNLTLLSWCVSVLVVLVFSVCMRICMMVFL